MIIHTFKQYSPEYWDKKIGKISSSRMAKYVTATGKKSASWKDDCFKLAAEIVLNRPEETFQSDAMSRGLDMEIEARKSFEFIEKIKIDEVGIVEREDYPGVSCSPDGLSVDRKTGFEAKCPSPSIHLKYLYENKLPTIYKPQVFSSLWLCTELERYAFYSYHPEMKKLLVYTDRDNEEYQTYAAALENYLPDMLEFIQKAAKEG